MKTDRRGSWYLLTGLILGVALGLVYAWLVSPVKYVDAPPYALRADYKDEYRALIASAYMYNLDLLRAQGRIAQLKDDNPIQVLALQAQQALSEGRPVEEARALDELSLALVGIITPGSSNQTSIPRLTDMPSTGVLSPTPLLNIPTVSQDAASPATPTPVNALVPILTSTLPPTGTATPTPTPGGPFVLRETRMMCIIGQSKPLIRVEVHDAAGQPVPGAEVWISWEGGEDHFFTGLQPELGLGYGDFTMTPDIVYSIRISIVDQAANELSAAECVADDGSSYWGTWYLVFTQE